MTTSDFNITSLASLFTSNSLILRNSGVSSFRLNNTTSATTWYFENHRNAPSGSLEITNSLSNAGLTMFSTRNVGINTNTDAGFKLDVNGTARVSGAVTGGLYNGVLVSSRTATQSVFIGVDAGSSATASMAHNVIMGHSAAYSMTTGNWNTIIGRQAATLSATINNSILIGANNLNQYTGTITDVLSFGVASTNVSFVSYPIFGTGIKDASPSFRIGGNNDLALSALPSVTASAILDLTSTTKGFLPPRMTTTQINAIATPAEGLMAYNTTISHLCVYQAGAWAKLSHSPM
jgi:hypothetical protein